MIKYIYAWKGKGGMDVMGWDGWMDGWIACKKPSGFKKLNETTTISVKVQYMIQNKTNQSTNQPIPHFSKRAVCKRGPKRRNSC
jgi:hypothetical protein